ncbi:MAG: SpoVR family protein, partial [Sporolactobacillus sp.]
EYSRGLEDWQRDILTMLREEMLYFWPQLETKIMNEGWASYWHVRIMRALDLSSDESVEFAKLNAQVVQPSKQSINPYYLGVKIFEDIEEKYNRPDAHLRHLGVQEGSGREKLFEVRELESDQSFIRNYLSKDLVQREDLFLFEKKGENYTVTDKDWKNVRDQLVSMRINGGFPYIVVEDGDYQKNGELLLKHRYEGIELDLRDLQGVLGYLVQLWGRPVHLQTVIEDHPTLFSCEKTEVKRKRLD